MAQNNNELTKVQLSATSYYLQGTIPGDICPKWDDMIKLKPAEKGKVVILGKEIDTPRYSAHYMKPYYYTGKEHDAKDLPQVLQPFLNWTNELLKSGIFGDEMKNMEFNQALMNFYMEGSHYIGKHSDNEKQLISGSPVFSASFGEIRTFRIRDKNGDIINDIQMHDCTYIIMCGNMQKEFTHEVPKVTGEKGLKMGPRINITFRVFK